MNPVKLLPILAFIAQIPVPSQEYANDFVELCSGEGHLTRALWAHGFHGKAFDVNYSKNHDFLRTVGFIAVLLAVRNTKKGGMLFVAPPCSTWVFMSRSSTGRSWLDPDGCGSKCVSLANVFCMRLLYILWYACQRGIYIVIEQPMTSVLFAWAPMRKFLMSIRARRVTFPMGAYGASTLKMTTLWGNLPDLTGLWRPLNRKLLMEALARRNGINGLVRKTVDKNGKKRVTGIKSKLASSATYPRGFGVAIARMMPSRGARPDDLEVVCESNGNPKDLDALGDILKGAKHTWWRKL